MIISTSRRTDIPCYYSEWFLNRINAGLVQVRNPFNAAQVRTVSLLPKDVDGFVFWTKDPKNMADKLPSLDRLGFVYYFQFTLTPYGRDIERRLREKYDIEDTFIDLSRRIGRERVIWRYDPIILNDTLTIDWHRQKFVRMCERLAEYTLSVTISFVDMYSKLKTNLIREITYSEMIELAGIFSGIGKEYGLSVKSCCEKIDLAEFGISHASCVDGSLIESLCGHPINTRADKNQREGCGCAASIDIGVYNTCGNGCVYCYANHSDESIRRNVLRHNPEGEILIG